MTVSGVCDLQPAPLLRLVGGFWGLGGTREKVSRVTVSGVWEDTGKGVTCNGFCGLGGTRGNGFCGLGGTRGKVSHVTVSGAWERRRKKCHM